jgi:hypothetical protein
MITSQEGLCPMGVVCVKRIQAHSFALKIKINI